MIVTRFPPSPTGYLHVGSARTALFCYLLARRYQGRFILRIEDTDLKRNTPTATQQVINDLRWLGLDWDEGPDIGGPNEPYLQSQRRGIYDKYIEQLLETGKAYYCFDTPQQLQALRDQAAAEKKTFIYPRPEKFPTPAQAARARDQGSPVVVRFVMPHEPIVVNDVVRGNISIPPDEFGDFIIQKSDGFPTYHFAVVVDDELMGVTHVIRGQEHLMNTPSHLALQHALGFRTPIYAHMSVTVSEGGGKLSKRERAKTLRKAIKADPDLDLTSLATIAGLSPDEMTAFLKNKSTPDAPAVTALAQHLDLHLPEINVIDFFHSGYLPEAVVNFVALLGWSPGGDREIMSLDELIAAFDLNRLNKTNSFFDRQKLLAFNTEHMRLLPPDKLLSHFKNYLQAIDSPLARADDTTLAHLLRVCPGARTLADIERKSVFLFTDEITFDPKAVKRVLQKPGAVGLLKQTRNALAELHTWDEPTLDKTIEALCKENNVNMGKICQPIRVAITGTTISPPIHDSLILLSQEKTLQRIDNTLQYLKEQE